MLTGLLVEESVRMTEDRDKWRQYVHGLTGEMDKSVRCLCEIFWVFNVPKLLKLVNFDRVIRKIKRWTFWGHSVYTVKKFRYAWVRVHCSYHTECSLILWWTWSLYFVLYLVCIYACAVLFLCRYRIFGIIYCVDIYPHCSGDLRRQWIPKASSVTSSDQHTGGCFWLARCDFVQCFIKVLRYWIELILSQVNLILNVMFRCKLVELQTVKLCRIITPKNMIKEEENVARQN